MKKHTKIALFLCILLFFAGRKMAKAQTHYPLYNPAYTPAEGEDKLEKIGLLWSAGLTKIQQKLHASDEDFKLFTHFYKTTIDSDSYQLFQLAKAGKLNLSNAGNYINNVQQKYIARYSGFLAIKTDYQNTLKQNQAPVPVVKPLTTPTCSPMCTNMDFSDGNLSGWYGYYGLNNYPSQLTSPTTSYNITIQGGGYLGAVQSGAISPLTNTPQVHMTSAGETDWFLNTYESPHSMSQASPWGTGYSAMIGDSTNIGTSTLGGGGVTAILSQEFEVTPTTNSITYAYSVFLENPSHYYYQQPFFNVTVFDQNGDTIPNCGKYDVVSGPGLPGFIALYWPEAPNGADTVYWKPWTEVNVPLKSYIGQCVTLQFEVTDCERGGHFGYAYVDASCAQLAITASSQVMCANGTIILYGPAGESAYSWFGPPKHSVLSNPALQNVTVDSGGTYTLVVTPATGALCKDTIYYTVGVDKVIVSATGTNITCNGGSNGTAIATAAIVTGGTLPFTYAWAPSGGSRDTATGLQAGTYTVTAIDAVGCSATATVTLTQPPAIKSTVKTTGVSCNGGNDGIAALTTKGGTPPYTYLWTPAGGTNATATGLSSAIYTVTITDSVGCTGSTTATISQPPVLTLSTVMTESTCGASNGTATAKANGGTSPYTYAWAPAGGANALATGLLAGTYTATVTDKNSCTTTSVIIVTDAPGPTLSISPVPELCYGGNTGIATATPTGGTSPFTYTWLPTGGNTPVNKGLTAGTYTLTLQDVNGCIATASVTITQPPELTAIILGTTPVSCFGGNDGTATATASGGTGAYTYLWEPGGNNNALATGLDATIYTVLVTDSNGCTSSTIAGVTQPSLLTVTCSGTQIICAGTPTTITAYAAGGTAPYSYTWNNGATTSAAIVSPTVPQTYTVVVTDANGCTATGQTSINFGPPISVSISGPNAICAPKTITLCANTTGGTGGNVYTWQPGNSSGPCITLSPTVTTTYSVSVTDNCGVSASDSAIVNINPVPDVNFYAYLYQGCKPLCIQFYSATTISGGGPASYSWQFGNEDTSLNNTHPIYCYPDTGHYSVTLTVTSDSGCSSTLRKVNLIDVFGPPNAAFTISPQPTSILNPTILFTDQTTDPNGGITYWTWTYGDNLDSVGTTQNTIHTYQDTGTFCATLIAMDHKGCSDTATNCLIITPFYTLYIPDAFTPNGDGLNETFAAKGTYVKDFEMYIFDRWGEQLYHATDINKGWNGTVKGGTSISQEDVYVYRILATDWQNHQHIYIGRVTLLK